MYVYDLHGQRRPRYTKDINTYIPLSISEDPIFKRNLTSSYALRFIGALKTSWMWTWPCYARPICVSRSRSIPTRITNPHKRYTPFKKVTQAWQVLSNESGRQQYKCRITTWKGKERMTIKSTSSCNRPRWTKATKAEARCFTLLL